MKNKGQDKNMFALAGQAWRQLSPEDKQGIEAKCRDIRAQAYEALEKFKKEHKIPKKGPVLPQNLYVRHALLEANEDLNQTYDRVLFIERKN